MNTTSATDNPQTKFSEEFNAEDADLTYESSDGVRFRVHSVFLRAHTEGLPPLNNSTLDIASLTEPASVLEILFKFIYPQRLPNLETEFEFNVLKQVAEAAEKYQVFPAMYACFLHMGSALQEHVSDVLGYALKHDYAGLTNQAASFALDRPMIEVVRAIPSEFHMTWLAYYSNWLEIQKLALTVHLPLADAEAISKIAGSLHALHDLDKTLGSNCHEWKTAIKTDIANRGNIMTLVQSSDNTRSTGPSAPSSQGDVTIECGNEVELRADHVVLTACAPGFESLFNAEPCPKLSVPENSSIIMQLFNFIRPSRYPNFEGLEFEELKELAYAAEKYRVSQAMCICKFFIRKSLPNNAEEIFVYAGTFAYHDILDVAAPLVLHLTLDDVSSRLPATIFRPWVQYLQQWKIIAQNTIEHLLRAGNQFRGNRPGICYCGEPFSKHTGPVILRILQNPQPLTDLNELFPDKACVMWRRPPQTPDGIFGECQHSAEDAIKEIRPISSFIL